jgi:hypothetical protein
MAVRVIKASVTLLTFEQEAAATSGGPRRHRFPRPFHRPAETGAAHAPRPQGPRGESGGGALALHIPARKCESNFQDDKIIVK